MIVTTTRHVNVTCCSSPHSSLLLLIMITKGVAQVCVPDFPPPLSHTRVFPHCLEVGTKTVGDLSVVVADDGDDN